ncbi:MAG: LacI family DNA-binding transcriptional regulator [Edaphobacter sp.]
MNEKAVTVRDIAKALDISVGTVDRALHNRPEVNAATCAAVLRMAKKLGYRPNQAARYLSTGRKLNIAVSLPREIAAFFDQIQIGIEEEAQALAETGVQVSFHRFSRMGVGDEASFQTALESVPDGILMVPGPTKTFKSLIKKAAEAGIPVMCVATDAPGTTRISVVSIDPEASGALAAELMGRFLRGCGKVALVTGALSIADHAQKLKSYSRISKLYFPKIEILPLVETHETEREAYEKIRSVLEKHDVAGVYVSTINAMPVLQALRDTGLLGKTTVVTTDLFSELVPYLESSEVAATIYQRPRTQGQIALRMLHRYLMEGEKPRSEVRLAPHLVMRGNLPFFLQQKMASGSVAQVRKDLDKLL